LANGQSTVETLTIACHLGQANEIPKLWRHDCCY